MTQIKNEFGSALYRGTNDMVKGIAQEWITAGGSWDDDMVASILCDFTDAELAAECVEGFDLDFIGDDDRTESHMKFNGYGVDDLAAEFREMRQ